MTKCVFCQITLVKTPNLILLPDQGIQQKRYSARKGFEEGWEETTFLLNIFVFERLLCRQDPKQGSFIAFQLSGSSRAGCWAGAECGELEMPSAPGTAPQCPGEGSRAGVGDWGQLRPSWEVMAAMRGCPNTGELGA